MIVKVQISHASSDLVQRVLVCNKDRSIQYEEPLDLQSQVGGFLDYWMPASGRMYFEATVNPTTKKLVLGAPAPDQDW